MDLKSLLNGTIISNLKSLTLNRYQSSHLKLNQIAIISKIMGQCSLNIRWSDLRQMNLNRRSIRMTLKMNKTLMNIKLSKVKTYKMMIKLNQICSLPCNYHSKATQTTQVQRTHKSIQSRLNCNKLIFRSSLSPSQVASQELIVKPPCPQSVLGMVKQKQAIRTKLSKCDNLNSTPCSSAETQFQSKEGLTVSINFIQHFQRLLKRMKKLIKIESLI